MDGLHHHGGRTERQSLRGDRVDEEFAASILAKLVNIVPIRLSTSRVERRLQKLEGILTDHSRFAPNSPKWIEYWDRQFYLYLTGEDRHAIRRASVDTFRAVMKYADENPASLVGSIPPDDEEGSTWP